MQSAVLGTSSLHLWMTSYVLSSTLGNSLFGVTAYCSSYSVLCAVIVHIALIGLPRSVQSTYDIAFDNAYTTAGY